MWDFSTDPEFQKKLDWMKTFIAEEVSAMDLVFNKISHPFDVHDKRAVAALKPLQDAVKREGLWACHLGPELGGKGYGQVKLALMNELFGGSLWAPRVFGCQAPDSGNAEILAMFGTPEQKKRFLQPLLDGEIVSCFSMTEPQGGADPKVFNLRAELEGDEWVLNGEKWFSSNARYAAFLIVMAVTDPAAPPKSRYSMFMVPSDTPGVNIVRNVGLMGESEEDGSHAYIRYENVRLPADALLGGVGRAFAVAQARLGGGRVHHAMRTVGSCRRALDMMCERAVSRFTQGTPLSEKQSVQAFVADSTIELAQFRLLLLHTAWTIDQGDHAAARTAIAMVKAATPKVYQDIVHRAIQVHGSLGASNEMPFGIMLLDSVLQGLVDGPTEVHKITVARAVLKQYQPVSGLFPSQHLPSRVAAAKVKLAEFIGEPT